MLLACAGCCNPRAAYDQSAYDQEYRRAQDFQAADQTLNQVYQQLWSVLDPQRQARLRGSQMAWIRHRNQACTIRAHSDIYINFDCVTRATEQRTVVLTAMLHAPAPPVTYGGEYTVMGTAMAWLSQPGGLNRNYPNGTQDGSGPTVLTLAGLKAKPEQTVIITYVSGLVSIGGGWAGADANGTTGFSEYDHGGDGSTGQPFPSAYMTPYPIDLGALVGTFTDGSGQIVGQPFAIGDGPTREIIPPGATQLQLGINDDRLSDNSGQFTVTVNVAPDKSGD
jgi:uncharacterized protein YecT (DUF1311 family)